MMKLHSYEVIYDTGFAPNPFYGFCTLATCKPDIRGKAEKGDWVIGVGIEKNKLKGKLVYAMQVTERLTFDEYFNDKRFSDKKPTRDSWQQKRGDNIYELGSDGCYRRLSSFHHEEHKDEDTGTNRVLISNKYVYYGANGPLIPAFENKRKIEELTAWIKDIGLNGYVGNPLHHDWDWAWPGC